MAASGRLAARLGPLEPLVVFDGATYGVGRSAATALTMVSAFGVRHPLRPLASARVWQEHSARVTRDEFLRTVTARLAGNRGPEALLVYFLSVLVPRVESRDWGERPSDFAKSPQAQRPGPLRVDLAAAARSMPAPRLPGPSLIVAGRAWRLAAVTRSRGLHVISSSGVWAPCGEYLDVGTIEARWRIEMGEAADRVAAECVEQAIQLEDAELADASREARRTGGVQRGPLVFLATTPPLIGMVMPPHYNASLDRNVNDDVVIATPFRVATTGADLSALKVFARTPSDGPWHPATLEHGICLGRDMPNRPPDLDPDLSVVAYLRWAATRFATNGKFHEHD